MDAPPGTVRVFSRDEITSVPTGLRVSPHEPTINDALIVLDFAGTAPRDVVLVGGGAGDAGGWDVVVAAGGGGGRGCRGRGLERDRDKTRGRGVTAVRRLAMASSSGVQLTTSCNTSFVVRPRDSVTQMAQIFLSTYNATI